MSKASTPAAAGNPILTPVRDLVSTGGGLWIYPVHGPITGAKTEAEAQRVADAVNKAWREAIAAEQPTPRILAKPETTKNLLLPKPVELMERSGWIEGRDPWEPGVYEVEWSDQHGDSGFALFAGVTGDAPYGWHCGGGGDDDPSTAPNSDPAGYRPLRWRGITEAEARNLGLVK